MIIKGAAIIFILFIAASIILLHDPAYAAEEEKEESGLYFTYIGATGGWGINKIECTRWFTDKRETRNYSGNYASGGIVLAIFAESLIGEFSIQYINNRSDGEPDVSVQHLIYTALGRYSFPITDRIGVASGIGLYMETPPSDRGYDGGGGFAASFSILLGIGLDFKLVIDAQGRYGRFGIGEDSRKISYGALLGVLYSVGRI